MKKYLRKNGLIEVQTEEVNNNEASILSSGQSVNISLPSIWYDQYTNAYRIFASFSWIDVPTDMYGKGAWLNDSSGAGAMGGQDAFGFTIRSDHQGKWIIRGTAVMSLHGIHRNLLLMELIIIFRQLWLILGKTQVLIL